MISFKNLLQNLADYLNKKVQGDTPHSAYRDWHDKSHDISIEDMVTSSLANLMCLFFKMPVAGGNARARWLDELSTDYCNDKLQRVVQSTFATGDSITVPFFDGLNITNIIIDSDNFQITAQTGGKITGVIYVVDSSTDKSGNEYTLLQSIDLVPYVALDGTSTFANAYKLIVAKNKSIAAGCLADMPGWNSYVPEWQIPNVDRLLVARYRSTTIDPNNLNAIKGTAICFGASKPIAELHYLYDALHDEFELSEKAIIADKSIFANKRITHKNSDGTTTTTDRTVLPKGRERVFVDVKSGQRNVEAQPLIHEWAPTLREQSYIAAIEEQKKLVEECIGVSTGIISNVNDQSYQNVDNVRKATIKTQGFINTNRKACEQYLDDLLYAWSTLANFYGINDPGDYEATYGWSDEYINTFADKQNAILAGVSIGATDAVDYRAFLYDEPVDVAAQRIAEIKAAEVTPDVITV
jgi:hypothetical protein